MKTAQQPGTDPADVAVPTLGNQFLSSSMRAVTVGIPPLLTLLALTGLWELLVRVLDVPAFILPPPSSVATTAFEWRAELVEASRVTLFETLAGFALASVIAIPLAFFMVQWAFLRRTLYPILLVLQSVPKVAVAPILVVWVGFGPTPKIIIAALVCFFPVFVDTATGFASTPRELLDLARSLGSGRIQTLVKFRFPFALPHVFVGLKVGITLAVIGAVVAEFVQSSSGLGYLILVSSTQLNTSLGFAAITILSLISITLFYGLHWLEILLVPWAEERVTEQ